MGSWSPALRVYLDVESAGLWAPLDRRDEQSHRCSDPAAPAVDDKKPTKPLSHTPTNTSINCYPWFFFFLLKHKHVVFEPDVLVKSLSVLYFLWWINFSLCLAATVITVDEVGLNRHRCYSMLHSGPRWILAITSSNGAKNRSKEQILFPAQLS